MTLCFKRPVVAYELKYQLRETRKETFRRSTSKKKKKCEQPETWSILHQISPANWSQSSFPFNGWVPVIILDMTTFKHKFVWIIHQPTRDLGTPTYLSICAKTLFLSLVLSNVHSFCPRLSYPPTLVAPFLPTISTRLSLGERQAGDEEEGGGKGREAQMRGMKS